MYLDLQCTMTLKKKKLSYIQMILESQFIIFKEHIYIYTTMFIPHLGASLPSFFFHLLILLLVVVFIRQRDRILLLIGSLPKCPFSKSRAGPSCSQEPGIQFQFPTWLTGIQVQSLGHYQLSPGMCISRKLNLKGSTCVIRYPNLIWVVTLLLLQTNHCF